MSDTATVQTFRRIGTTVEAMQLTESNTFEVCEWSQGVDLVPDDGNVHAARVQIGEKPKHIIIILHDWVVKHPNGGYSRYTSEQFQARFEEV